MHIGFKDRFFCVVGIEHDFYMYDSFSFMCRIYSCNFVKFGHIY